MSATSLLTKPTILRGDAVRVTEVTPNGITETLGEVVGFYECQDATEVPFGQSPHYWLVRCVDGLDRLASRDEMTFVGQRG